MVILLSENIIQSLKVVYPVNILVIGVFNKLMFIKHIYDMLGFILDAGNLTRNNTKKFPDLMYVFLVVRQTRYNKQINKKLNN